MQCRLSELAKLDSDGHAMRRLQSELCERTDDVRAAERTIADLESDVEALRRELQTERARNGALGLSAAAEREHRATDATAHAALIETLAAETRMAQAEAQDVRFKLELTEKQLHDASVAIGKFRGMHLRKVKELTTELSSERAQHKTRIELSSMAAVHTEEMKLLHEKAHRQAEHVSNLEAALMRERGRSSELMRECDRLLNDLQATRSESACMRHRMVCAATHTAELHDVLVDLMLLEERLPEISGLQHEVYGELLRWQQRAAVAEQAALAERRRARDAQRVLEELAAKLEWSSEECRDAVTRATELGAEVHRLEQELLAAQSAAIHERSMASSAQLRADSMLQSIGGASHQVLQALPAWAVQREEFEQMCFDLQQLFDQVLRKLDGNAECELDPRGSKRGHHAAASNLSTQQEGGAAMSVQSIRDGLSAAHQTICDEASALQAIGSRLTLVMQSMAQAGSKAHALWQKWSDEHELMCELQMRCTDLVEASDLIEQQYMDVKIVNDLHIAERVAHKPGLPAAEFDARLKLNVELLTLQNEHASLNNRFSRLDAEARKQHAELDRQLRDERSMNLELQALIDRVQPDLNRLETALQSARHELQTQRSGSARLQVELENAVLSGQLEASRAADLQLEMDAVRRDNIRLRDECSTATSKLRKMEENFKEGASSQQARMPCDAHLVVLVA